MNPEIERELCLGRGGFYRFVRLAWPHAPIPGLPPFRGNWHLAAVSRVLEEYARGERTRTVVNVPPSTGKSVFTGIFLPAWVWTWWPSCRWVFTSYDDDLLFRDSRAMVTLMRSAWYRERFGDPLPRAVQKIAEIDFVGGGVRLNTSIGGAATGQHGHRLLIDDPNKAIDALDPKAGAFEATHAKIGNTFFSRRASEDFASLLMCQRLASGDVAGRFIEEAWERVAFPMLYDPDDAHEYDQRTEPGEPLFPSRFSAAACAELKTTLGPAAWAAQYQQKPEGSGGGVFDPLWLGPQIEIDPCDVPFGCVTAQSWDLTFKGKDSSDWIAGGSWAYKNRTFYLRAEPVFERASFVETLRQIDSKRDAEGWEASKILIEDKANGPAVESVLSEEFPGLVDLVNPEGSKTARAHAVTPIWSSGRVKVVRGPYLKRWRQTFPKFPHLQRDDEIDQMSQALRWLGEKAGYWAAIGSVFKRGP